MLSFDLAAYEVDDHRLKIVRGPQPRRAYERLDLSIREDGHRDGASVTQLSPLVGDAPRELSISSLLVGGLVHALLVQQPASAASCEKADDSVGGFDQA